MYARLNLGIEWFEGISRVRIGQQENDPLECRPSMTL